eukprot:5805165-Alexandrium_andersonii.AAC.1
MTFRVSRCRCRSGVRCSELELRGPSGKFGRHFARCGSDESDAGDRCWSLCPCWRARRGSGGGALDVAATGEEAARRPGAL